MINVKKEDIIKYYIEKNMTAEETYKKLNIGKSTFYNRIKKYNIKKPKNLSQKKREEAFIKKYGVKNPSQNSNIQKKREETFVKKYKVKNPGQNKKIQEKMKKTNLKRYGVDNPLKNKEVREKIKKTNFKKYGTVNSAQSSILNIDIWNNKYLFLKWCKDFNSLNKRKPNYTDISIFFNVHQTTAHKKIKEFNAEEFYDYETNISSYQLLVETWLNNHNIAFTREFQLSNRMKVDLCVEKNNKNRANEKILIEVNPTATHNIDKGFYGHTPKIKKDYHYKKTKQAYKDGYRLIHIFEKDLNNLENILGFLLAQTNIINYDFSYGRCKEFLDKNHRQGSMESNGYIAIVDDEIVACMTFRKDGLNTFKLSRLCYKKGVIVHGFSKMAINKFIKDNPSCTKIKTYCDININNCQVYRRLGFKKINHSLGYNWVKGSLFLSRNKCQKHNLLKKYPQYSDSDTEVKIMLDLGYVRVYNAGNFTYEMILDDS